MIKVRGNGFTASRACWERPSVAWDCEGTPPESSCEANFWTDYLDRSKVRDAAVLAGAGDVQKSSASSAQAWVAAPQQSFMRQKPEDELRQTWKEGRKDARLAYRKLHDDTVRQRRKDVESGRVRRGGAARDRT